MAALLLHDLMIDKAAMGVFSGGPCGANCNMAGLAKALLGLDLTGHTQNKLHPTELQHIAHAGP